MSSSSSYDWDWKYLIYWFSVTGIYVLKCTKNKQLKGDGSRKIYLVTAYKESMYCKRVLTPP